MRAGKVKKLLIFVLAFAAFMVLCPSPARAQGGEIYEKSGAPGLFDSLDD